MYMLGFLFVCLVAVSGSKLPSTVQRCLRSQPDFQECFAKSGRDVLSRLTVPRKDLGLPQLEPLEIPLLSVSGGNGSVAFQQDYKNVKWYGVTKHECSKVKLDFVAKELLLECTSEEMYSEFEYEYKGKFLLLPFNGKGPGVVRLMNVSIVVKMKFDEFEKNGQKYWKVVQSEMTSQPKKIVFALENLFGGDKALSDGINNVINENWDAFWEETGPSYNQIAGKVFGQIVNNFFAKFSLVELFGEA